eukprot:TRINITY_DN2079_c0_g1_i1.p1 TRINITY_DN2079_c0_g1~~TRINITY_DN2079_c0_g1_i1.p1  ORF type:complete len:199 (-),score=40.41 TRINITY_DN2079_c0_g1_i1:44-640(-)
MADEKAYPMKVVLLGQSFVGKSSIVLRFVQDKFFPKTEGTIGAAFLTKALTLDDGTNVKFEIWDTAGQERYHSLAPMYYRGAQGAIIVYDVSSRESFEKAKKWVEELKEKSNPDQIVAFVGNKVDLKRVVPKEDADRYAMENGLISLDTSALDNVNVKEIFTTLAERLPKTNAPDSQRPVGTALLSAPPESTGSKCPC